MKTISYYLVLPLSLTALAVHSNQCCEVSVQTERITVTTTGRAPQSVIHDIGILCETLLEKPNLYSPQLLLEVFAMLVEELIASAPQEHQHELKQFQQDLIDLQKSITCKKLPAHDVLDTLTKKWPQKATILPNHVYAKLERFKQNLKDKAALVCRLQAALFKNVTSFAHRSAQAVKSALFNR